MRDFLVRHPLMAGILAAGILWTLALVLVLAATRHSYYYIFIMVLGFVIFVGALVFEGKWQWVCTKCSRVIYFPSARKKYCSECDGVMALVKKEKPISCPNGHYVERWDKFCPKCRAPLRRKLN